MGLKATLNFSTNSPTSKAPSRCTAKSRSSSFHGGIMSKQRILILGGGFGGLYAALEFEKALKKGADIEVTLVNRENYFLFTPMLHEVAASDLDLSHIVNPIRKLLKR